MGIRRPSLTVEEARRRAEQKYGLDSPARAEAEPHHANAPPAQPASSPAPALGTSRAVEPRPQRAPVPSLIQSSGPVIVARSGAKKGLGPGVGGISAKGTAAPRQMRVTADGEAKQQLFLSVAIPAKGVSGSFDSLCQNHTPAKALQLILRRALLLYERSILNGEFVHLAADYDEETSSEAAGVVQTSRTMMSRTVAVAKGYFDPLSFESDRAFGRMLATAALAAFFEIEKQG
jgi:VirC2 protein